MDRPPLWKRVPWIVYALAAPLAIMGIYRLVVGPGRAVPLVGSGVLAQIQPDHAPEGSRYVLQVVQNESATETERRVREALSHWPDVLVFGFAESVQSDPEAPAIFERLAHAAENATSVPVVVGFATTPPWFDELCDQSSLRLCVEPGDDPQAAVAAAIDEAWQRHRRLEASTQVGR